MGCWLGWIKGGLQGGRACEECLVALRSCRFSAETQTVRGVPVAGGPVALGGLSGRKETHPVEASRVEVGNSPVKTNPRSWRSFFLMNHVDTNQ